MADTKTEKLNIEFPEATEFSLCPVQFLGKRKGNEFNPFTNADGSPLARAKTKLLSRIWTEQKNFGKAKISKVRFSKKCGIAYSVVIDSLKQLVDAGLITETSEDTYKIVPKVNGKSYFVLEDYLHTKKFNIDGKFKTLGSTSVMLLDRVKSFYLEKDEDGNYINYDFKNREPINYFYSSEKGFATLLGLPKSTVSYAILPLLKLGLMHRNKRLRYKDENDNTRYKIVQIKSVTGNATSIFTVPYEVLAVEQRSTYTPQKVDFIENIDEIEITEEAIEKAYAELRQEAEQKTAAARELAFQDEEFITAQAELDEAMNATFAALDNGEHVQEAKELWDSAQARYIKRLAELGISEEELSEPQYICRKCGDTGFTDTGQRCRCRANVKQLIISRIFKRK